MSAGGGCEAAVTVRTRCGWAKLRGLLCGRRCPLKLKGLFISHIGTAILYGCEAWYLKKGDGNISKNRDKCLEQ